MKDTPHIDKKERLLNFIGTGLDAKTAWHVKSGVTPLSKTVAKY